MAKETVDKKKGKDMMSVDIPAGAKYIVVFEHGGRMGLASGGFVNADEMLGFNRRALNPNVTEQFIMAGVQKQAQEQAQKAQQQEAVEGAVKVKPPNPGAAVQK